MTLLAGATLPLAALRFGTTPWKPALGGGTVLGLIACGIVHRALARRRRPGPAERTITVARLWIEGAGLALFAAGAVLLGTGRPLPLRLAFWALFLLRLSVADLLDPSRLAGRTGLKGSAVRDLKNAASSGRARRNASSRLRRGLAGASKGALFLLWLALPLLAALAPGEVAAGEWPPSALWLRLYPSAALLLTALLLVGGGPAGPRAAAVGGSPGALGRHRHGPLGRGGPPRAGVRRIPAFARRPLPRGDGRRLPPRQRLAREGRIATGKRGAPGPPPR